MSEDSDKASDGRAFERLHRASVWVCIETGDAVVFGDPRDVEPPEWSGDGPPAGCDDDDERAHNCDAARCSSVEHRLIVGRIAGRGLVADDVLAERNQLIDMLAEILDTDCVRNEDEMLDGRAHALLSAMEGG